MSCDEFILNVNNISKCFEIYDNPLHRLMQTLAMGKKDFYNEFWALKDINFGIKKGECIGIIGKNGAGKSTLLQIITGTLNPSGGNVEKQGKIAALLELGSGFNPEFTGKENVFLNGSLLGLTNREIKEKYDQIVEFADIGNFIDQPVKTYSSGMLVRLAFAVQVMVEPEILIVDEALAVGDAQFQRKCYARLDRLIEEGMTMIIVTHDTEIVKRICDRCLYLREGKLIFDGKAEQGVLKYLQDLFPQTDSQCNIVDDIEQSNSNKAEKELQQYVLTADPTNINMNWGTGGAGFSAIKLHGLIAPNILQSPGVMTIEVDVQWDIKKLEELFFSKGIPPNINVGIHISDVRNINLYGTNTMLEEILINPYERKKITVFFELDLPLVSGDYFISPAIAIGNLTNSTQVHFTDRAINFRSENSQQRVGLVHFKTIASVK